jgi:hypothetical protein
MSYVSFLRNIPDLLGQPAGIAALASLGIHGAIAFILPLMPVDSAKSTKQAASSKPIGLLELNASEQNRLPQKTPLPTSIQAQLPPLPGQIPALPAQQQIPFNLDNTTLPPAPPAGSTAMTGLPPLPQNPGYTISSLPKSSSYQLNRKDLLLDPSFKSNSPSVAFSGNKLSGRYGQGTRRFNSDIAYGQPIRPSSLPEVASAGIPSNISANPTQLPLPSDVSPPIGGTMPDNSTPAQPNQSAIEASVTPDNFVAPVGEIPKSGEGNLAFAPNGMQRFQVQPGQSELLAGTNATATAPAGVAAPNSSNQTLASGNNSGNQKTLLDAYTQFKKQYPEGQSVAPTPIAIDKSKIERPVEVALSMDREGKIDSFDILGDTSSISSDSKLAIRDRLQQHFKENPAATNGKGKFFSFKISPDATVTNKPTEEKVSSEKLPTQSQLTNNQPAPVTPLSTTTTTKPFSGVEFNRPVSTPQVSSQRSTQLTPAASLPPLKVAPTTPVQSVPETVPPVRTLQPKVTPLPSKPVIVPTQTVKPVGETARIQPVPTPQESTKPIVEQLRDRKNQQSSVNSSPSLIERLRQAKQERENNN